MCKQSAKKLVGVMQPRARTNRLEMLRVDVPDNRAPETNGTRETCDELGIRMIAYSPLALGRG